MGNLEACRELLNEYLQRMRMTHDDFAGAIDYSRSYVTKVLNGNEKISDKFIERAVEIFAEYKVLKYRSEARELFALASVDIPPSYWTRPAFVELKNDDPPETGRLKEQSQVPVTGQVADKPAAAPNRPQEQPTPAILHAPLVAQSSGEINLQSSHRYVTCPGSATERYNNPSQMGDSVLSYPHSSSPGSGKLRH